MPIKSLTQRDVYVYPRPRVPKLANVNKGAEKEPNRAGFDLDHFRVTFEPEWAHLAEPFAEMYGAKPRTLPGIMLTGSTVETAFPHWMEEWAGGNRLVHRCDGETQAAWFDGQQQKTVKGARPCELLAGGKCKCHQTATLFFYLPDFTRATGAFGYFKLDTGAWEEIDRFASFLADFEEQGIPLKALRFNLLRKEETRRAPITDKKTGEITSKPKQTWVLYLTLQEQSFDLMFALPPAADILPLAPGLTPALPAVTDPTRTAAPANKAPAAPPPPADIDAEYEVEDDPDDAPNGGTLPPPPNGWDGNWKAGSAAKLIPAIRQATGINPPDLFDVLAQLGSNAHPGLSVEHIAALVLGGEVTLQNAEPDDADDPWAAYKLRTDPLEPDTYADLVVHLQARYGSEQVGQPVSTSQTRRIAMLVNAAFGADSKAAPDEDDAAKAARKAAKDQAEEARHALTQFCFGKEGASKLDADEALALILALSSEDPARAHDCAAEELVAIVAQVAALADAPPATPKANGSQGKPPAAPKPRKPSDLQVIYLAGLTFEDMEIADEQRRQAVWGWMKQAIKARNPKRKPGELDTDIRAALQYFTGDSEGIKNLTGDHVVALGHILDSAPDDATLGAELLLCAAGARLSPTEEPTAGDVE